MNKEQAIYFAAQFKGVVSQEEIDAAISLNCSDTLAWFLACSFGVRSTQISRVLAETIYGQLPNDCGVWIFALKDGRYCLGEGTILEDQDVEFEERNIEVTYAETPEACLHGPLLYDPGGVVRAGLKTSFMHNALGL
jgi:hypothetical protein